MLDIARTLNIIGVTTLELELGVSLSSFADIRLDESLRGRPPNAVAAAAIVKNNACLIRLDDLLLILERLVFMTKTKL